MNWESFINLSDFGHLAQENFLAERLRLFDLVEYKTHQDIANMSDYDSFVHFIKRGKLEGRSYNKYLSSFVDPEFYLETYGYFGLKNTGDAITHWMYDGAFMGCAPNKVVYDFFNAPVHLFQMGKVGSRSLYNSLKNNDRNIFIPHLHFSNEIFKTYPDSYYSYPEIIRYCRNDIFFISGVRDPIERLLSGLIQNETEKGIELGAERVNYYIENRGQLELYITQNVDSIINWFDHNFFCGINVFDYEFDCESGFAEIYQNEKSVFLYRLDKLPLLWDRISKFTNRDLRPTFDNSVINKGSELARLSKILYSTKFNKSVLEGIYNSKFCEHFFNRREIDNLIIKWAL